MKATKANITKVLNAAGFNKGREYGGKHHFGNRITRRVMTNGWFLDDDFNNVFRIKHRRQNVGEESHIIIARIAETLRARGMQVKLSSDGQQIWIDRAVA